MKKKRKTKKVVDLEGLKNFLNIHSKRMIENPTPQELLFRHHLSDLHYKFKTQVPFITPQKKGYILDFLLEESNVVIELDGWQHSTKQGRRKDAKRTKDLLKAGFHILRFTNKQSVTFSKKLISQVLEQKIKSVKEITTSTN